MSSIHLLVLTRSDLFSHKSVVLDIVDGLEGGNGHHSEQQIDKKTVER